MAQGLAQGLVLTLPAPQYCQGEQAVIVVPSIASNIITIARLFIRHSPLSCLNFLRKFSPMSIISRLAVSA